MKRSERLIGPFSCALIVLLLSGCATQSAVRPVLKSAQIESGISATEAQRLDGLCAFGAPLNDGSTDGTTILIVREGYALELSVTDKIPLWVCERVKKSHTQGDAKRKDNFKTDPNLDPGVGPALADYRGSGYDRGHQAPAADFKYRQERTDESFYLTNMCPQVGSGFNRDIWRVLEKRARTVVKDAGDAHIITGPIFYDPKEDDASTADGWIPYKTIGKNNVAVPTHFYKIIVAKDQSGEWHAIAFVLDNKRYPKGGDKDWTFEPFIQSIDWVEEHTGLNFMPDLDVEDTALDKALEREKSALWPEFSQQ